MDFLTTEFSSLILVFLSIAAGVMLVGGIIMRLQRPRSTEPIQSIVPPRIFGRLTEALAETIPIRETKRVKLKQELLTSGKYHSTALDNFLAARNVSVMCVLTGFGIMMAIGTTRGVELIAFVVTLVLGLIAYSLPRVILSSRSERRAEQIVNGFPDFLDLMLVSVDGGLSVERAMSRVASELADSHPSLSQELAIVGRQTETGSLDQALAALGERIDRPEVVACATMMRQSKRLGTRLADALQESADRMRDMRRQRAEQGGNLASLQLLLPVVLFLAPPVFIVLIGPALLDFREFINREKENASAVVQQANLPAMPRATNR